MAACSNCDAGVRAEDLDEAGLCSICRDREEILRLRKVIRKAEREKGDDESEAYLERAAKKLRKHKFKTKKTSAWDLDPIQQVLLAGMASLFVMFIFMTGVDVGKGME